MHFPGCELYLHIAFTATGGDEIGRREKPDTITISAKPCIPATYSGYTSTGGHDLIVQGGTPYISERYLGVLILRVKFGGVVLLFLVKGGVLLDIIPPATRHSLHDGI